MPRKKAEEAAPPAEAQEVVQAVAETTKMPEREPGDDTHLEKPQAHARHGKGRSTIVMPLPDGGVARYTDEGNFQGVGINIDHPDPNFRPSPTVNEPLKEEHPNRKRHMWSGVQKLWRKEKIGEHHGANPVAERLDSEGRFEEMVKRRKDEIEGDQRGF